jgi:hypothetical protein
MQVSPELAQPVQNPQHLRAMPFVSDRKGASMLGRLGPEIATRAASAGLRAALKERVRPGVLGSALLHAVVLLLILRGIDLSTTRADRLRILPVDLVHLAEPTAAAPGAPSADAAVPQPRARPARARTRLASLAPAVPVAPSQSAPPAKPADPLEARLQTLAQLHVPDSEMPALNGFTAGSSAGGDGTGVMQTYTVRDLVRAQVERRWNLDLGLIRGRRFTILIRVRFRRDGTVLSAEIVDMARAQSDSVYRSVALSARNAVLLSSPLTLPAGRYQPVTEVTLDLDPRATVR